MSNLTSLFKKDPLSERIKKIKNGNSEEREKMIKDYIPFIVKTISTKLSKYIEAENSEEYMIGLEAFNEAIDKYDFSKGNFLSYASLVIKSRMIDYMRKATPENITISIDQLNGNESIKMNYGLEVNKFNECMDLHIELNEFKNKLNQFNITFHDLVENSPKHSHTRISALQTAKYIVEHPKEKDFLYKKKRLPYLILVSEFKISRKFFDRNKKFIIAAVLILDSNLDILKTYINDAKRGSSNGL
ncbi:RNA polymerase sigma factor [Natronincola peptidivorans]|uniref:RNA polymerase sigma factor SigI n=1 Tax=Natronincola peptidivorans TaxID=426128 RepID=A0A1I0E0Y4_9FIRM|nr:RNA polymerase sigma-I factor [Natronincola peptidivorans]SET37823.1 RNA polymerase sigma factor [Natronincola peptidivorans]